MHKDYDLHAKVHNVPIMCKTLNFNLIHVATVTKQKLAVDQLLKCLLSKSSSQATIYPKHRHLSEVGLTTTKCMMGYVVYLKKLRH